MAGYMSWCLALLLVTTVAAKELTEIEELQQMVEQLSRQLMLQQLFVEERIRSDGASGLKQARLRQQGTKPYHASTVTGSRVASIHEHANNNQTVGMGEFIAVLNGVEFRTRHNDYKLVKPATVPNLGEAIKFNEVEHIVFPEVPPEVINQDSLEKQIEEMREWFKAWRDEDPSQRDYTKYFKPLLCYLEGGWTLSNNGKIDESFPSDRHFIDAKSWHDLQEKVKFTSYTGRKDSAENYAYLPTTIMSVDNGTALIAQWNYRILCHPLDKYLSTKRLDLIDDIASRMAFGRSMAQHGLTRAARYRVAPEDRDGFREKIIKYDLLDYLMAEIPGKDGYGNVLVDEGLDGTLAVDYKTGKPLKAGYYGRWFTASKDAMGSSAQHRGYADENVFMAKTTQDKVAPMKVEKCTGKRKNRICFTYSQSWTYAIPLEIIYMTPLNRWNPFNIEYKGSSRVEPGLSVTANGRNGRSKENALDGNNNKLYYRTPAAFFKKLKGTGDSADTAGKALWVLDDKGTPQQAVASGTRIHLPEIEGIGTLRTRYPIMPFTYEGSPEWKELTALKDLIMQPKKYKHIYYDQEDGGEEPTMVTLKMRTSRSSAVEPHEHYIIADLDDLRNLINNRGTTLELTTDERNGHTHTLKLAANSKGDFVYKSCDQVKPCWDKHPLIVDLVED